MPEIIRINNHDFTVSEIKAEMERLYKLISEKNAEIEELKKSVDIYKTSANNLFKRELR